MSAVRPGPRAAAWWPVGPSILAFIALALLPDFGLYLAIHNLGVFPIFGFFAVTFGLAALLTVFEFWFGRRARGTMINHTDVASAVFGFFITGSIGNGIMIALLAPLSDPFTDAIGIDLWPSSWPLIVQVVIGLVISDLVMYPIHRYMHKHDSLWRVHVVHHNVDNLRPMRNFLQHPFKILLLDVVPAIPLVLLGAPAIAATLVGAIRVTVGLVDHSSMPLRTGWLDYVIHTPNDHWWHHNLEDKGGTNFTTVVIPIDIIFGTFKKPPAGDPVPDQIGIAEPHIQANHYVRQLTVPFRWHTVEQQGHN